MGQPLETFAGTDRLLRLSEVLKIVPLGRSTIYSRMKAGAFPLARDLGGGVVAWPESDIRAWMENLPTVTKQ